MEALSGRIGGRSLAAASGSAGLCLAMTCCLLLGGCSSKCVNLGADRKKLDEVLLSDQPVLVNFWKWGCASCMSVEPVMNTLADEYRGRVVVARFQAAYFWLAATDYEVFKRYNFSFFPTAILFVDGQERHRWVWNTSADAYREVLDPLVGQATTMPDAQVK